MAALWAYAGPPARLAHHFLQRIVAIEVFLRCRIHEDTLRDPKVGKRSGYESVGNNWGVPRIFHRPVGHS